MALYGFKKSIRPKLIDRPRDDTFDARLIFL